MVEIEEVITLYADSAPCGLFYFGDNYFTSNFLSSDKVVELKDQISYNALLTIERLCQYMLHRGCVVFPGDFKTVDDIATLRLQFGENSFQMSANDGSLACFFSKVRSVTKLSLDNGIFYKDSVNSHGYTGPVANFELWKNAMCKETDRLLGGRVGRALRTLNSTKFSPDHPMLEFTPHLALLEDEGQLRIELHNLLKDYMTPSELSVHYVGDLESHSKMCGLDYQVEIILSQIRYPFCCTVQIDDRTNKNAAPFQVHFRIENDTFVIIHPLADTNLSRVEWTKALLLSVTRAWNNPGQFIAFGFKTNKQLDNVVEIKHRVIQVEKEYVACKICMDRPVDWAYMCGHVMCGECASQLQNVCPVCKKPVTQNLKLYF